MNDTESLPVFHDIHSALKSGSAFRLTLRAQANIQVSRIPVDQRVLLHNAFLCEHTLHLGIGSEPDLQFVISLLKAHPGLQLLVLRIECNLDLKSLAVTIQSSPIIEIQLAKNTVNHQNLDPVLRALQHNKTMKKLICSFRPEPYELQSMALAITNSQLETFSFFTATNLGDQQTNTDLWTALRPVLSKHESLRSLQLGSYGTIGCQAIGEILGKNCSIQSLGMTSYTYNITANDIQAICAGLATNTTLRKLFIKFLMEGAIRALFELLAHNRCQVSHLQITAVEFSVEDMQTLSESLKTNTALTQLDLLDCQLPDLQTLSDELAVNTSLTELRLKGAEIPLEGVKAICDVMIQNDTLKLLDLSFCSIGDVECELIAQMLLKNKSLTELVLVSNPFGSEGVNRICEALVHNRTIQKLWLNHSTFGMTGVKNMLTRNKTLRRLHVTISFDLEEPVDLLCDIIKHNDTLTHLFVYKQHTRPSDSVQQKFIDALKENYALDLLGFHDVPVPSFTALLRRNRQLKSSIRFKVTILCHNIARSSQALTTLPMEIWMEILSLVTHPGMDEFKPLVQKIFRSYLS